MFCSANWVIAPYIAHPVPHSLMKYHILLHDKVIALCISHPSTHSLQPDIQKYFQCSAASTATSWLFLQICKALSHVQMSHHLITFSPWRGKFSGVIGNINGALLQ
jgi:hypothetical protein